MVLLCVSCQFVRETRSDQIHYALRRHCYQEVERFAKENKALKATVCVVGALVLCFSPMGVSFVYNVIMNAKLPAHKVLVPFVRTFAILNSLLNPLIYCLRQTEMRKFFFRKKIQVVYPAH